VSTTADGASAVIAVDLDADGDVDLVSAAATSGVISWHENLDGAGAQLGRAPRERLGRGARSVAAGDIDGDGDLDLASASFDTDTIAWHDNLDGAGTAWLKRAVYDRRRRRARRCSRLTSTSDGDVDLASASANDDTLAWYESFDGTGTAWIERTITTAADGAAALALADVNGDGRPTCSRPPSSTTRSPGIATTAAALFRGEIVISGLAGRRARRGRGRRRRRRRHGRAVGVLRTTARSPGTRTPTRWAAPGRRTRSRRRPAARSVAAGDIDDDGEIDALSAAFDIDTVAWYQNGGDGGGAAASARGRARPRPQAGRVPQRLQRQEPRGAHAVDRGHEDLDATQIDVGSLRLGRADGDGETIAPITGPPGPHPQILDVSTAPGHADVCECVPAGPDGRPDLVLKFDSEDLAHVLELLGLPQGTTVQLELSGELFDDTPFAVDDCLLLVNS
jgi:hypothetical protein